MDATLHLKPDLSEIARMNLWLDDFAKVHSVPTDVAANIKLCLNELVANSISYGFEAVADPKLSVSLALSDGGLRAELRDNGIPFNPTDQPEVAPLSEGDFRIGGFGIKLVRDSADDVHYRRDGKFNLLSLLCLTTQDNEVQKA